MNKNNFVVILAGGIGSRFWPESRQQLPKQFLDILGTGQSLLQTTFHRFKPLVDPERIFVITHKDYKDKIAEHLPELSKDNIVCEPFRKNTAPAAAYITYKIKALNPKANIILSPADHLIVNEKSFQDISLQALEFVDKYDAILTLGIQPSRPDTGYGYIQYNMETVTPPVYKVKTFTEKPNLDLARTFLKSGDFLWNSGIFIWNVATFTKAFATYQPEMDDHFNRISSHYNTEKEKEIINKVYTQCNNISIDYALMEKAQNVYVIPANFGWSDLGTWNAAYENVQKNNEGNAIVGDTILTIDANNNFIKIPQNKLALVQGINDFIIIDTDNILMICERNKEQEIKEYINEIKKIFGETYL